jgi:Phage phiEco32-like COOH.NH2 ligase-type 2
MQFQELKSTFRQAVVTGGFTSLKDVPEKYTVGVPERLLGKWMAEALRVPPVDKLPDNPRLVNGCSIGADPECTFATALGVKKPAMEFGLQTGLAFGIDMNGRLMELRPTPSRFALDVVASILAELRWLAFFHPETRNYYWLAPPWDGQDGLGGHVHFARKRHREELINEVGYIGGVYSLLTRVGVFNKGLNDYRTTKTKYGKTHDFRPQRHGFEFRGYPTWLDSPWLAYFVLVISKLALMDPQLVEGIMRTAYDIPKNVPNALSNLLSFYKNVDDDARIALNALDKWGLPKQQGVDLRANWGLLYPEALKLADRPDYYPAMIEGTEAERQDIFDYLIKREPIQPRIPKCNWAPEKLPAGYTWMPKVSQTYHRIGIGEIISDLVFHNNCVVALQTSDNQNYMMVEAPNRACDEGFNALCGLVDGRLEVNRRKGDIYNLYLPPSLRTNETIPKVKKVLTSGLFPIWTVKDVREDSYSKWLARKQQRVNVIGKELEL